VPLPASVVVSHDLIPVLRKITPPELHDLELLVTVHTPLLRRLNVTESLPAALVVLLEPKTETVNAVTIDPKPTLHIEPPLVGETNGHAP
jgi:hypothetical protein